jgi:hypothetical protein
VDQAGRGFERAIPIAGVCGVALVRKGLDAAGIPSGPVFRPVWQSGRVRAVDELPTPPRVTDRSAASIPRDYGPAARLDASTFQVHSLRAGRMLAIDAARVTVRDITSRAGMPLAG